MANEWDRKFAGDSGFRMPREKPGRPSGQPYENRKGARPWHFAGDFDSCNRAKAAGKMPAPRVRSQLCRAGRKAGRVIS